MKMSSARFHPIAASAEQFLVTRAELRWAMEECLIQSREQLAAKACAELLNESQLLDLEKALHHEVGRCLDHKFSGANDFGQ